ncbi:MAG TPA: DUF2795 domain-containing protein [Acidimicrobiales bacterium]|nr:DUF2795 domain-containing protein [Acidimicrobiales bacterium]
MAIQRQSDKHTPRIDEELDHDTASITHGAPVNSRSREDLRQEDPGEDVRSSPSVEGGAPAGMSPDDVEIRAELARSLRPSVFPAHPSRLVEVAEEENASTLLIAFLRRLPDRRFEVLEEVYEALGEPGEQHRS